MHIPKLGPRVARHHSPLLHRWGRRFLSRRGWRLEGNLPDLSHMILLGAPHTSNWDLVYCLAFEFALGFKANWVGKNSLFFWPLGWLMARLGGVPVNRKFPRAMLRETVELFKDRERFILAIAPEGTRSKVERWKPGFHRIARAAQVPVVPVCLDFGTRTIRIGQAFTVTRDMEADIAAIRQFYAGAVGKHPENT